MVTHQHPGHEHGVDRRGVPGVFVGVAGIPGKVTAWGWGERRGEEGRQRRGEKGRGVETEVEIEEKKERRRKRRGGGRVTRVSVVKVVVCRI